jgi:hypothetical protein
MALETGTYISDLVATNPPGGDPVSQSDDHLRLIKSTVKATFPNISGAVTPTHTELNYVAGVTSAVQTQLNAKVPQSYFPNVNAAVSLTDEQLNLLDTKSLASAGYQKLPSGLVVQWGNVAATSVGAGSSVDVAVVFSIPFPTAVFVVLPTNGNTGAISFIGAGASSITTSGFNFGLKNSFTSSQSVSGAWLAIGN